LNVDKNKQTGKQTNNKPVNKQKTLSLTHTHTSGGWAVAVKRGADDDEGIIAGPRMQPRSVQTSMQHDVLSTSTQNSLQCQPDGILTDYRINVVVRASRAPRRGSFSDLWRVVVISL
jgi:kynureninase